MLVLPARLKLGYADSFLIQMAQAQTPDKVIDGYPEYATGLDQLEPLQRQALLLAAQTIVRSYDTPCPIKAVVVIGHADKALRKPLQERAAFELEISQLRASSARNALLSEVRRVAYDAHFSKVLLSVAEGVGNHRPVVHNAATEAQMKKNRRIEIFLFQMPLPAPRCCIR
jgi:flagellar motor protein MotB